MRKNISKIFLAIILILPMPTFAQAENTQSLLDIARANFQAVKQAVQEKVSEIAAEQQDELFTKGKELSLRIQEYAVSWMQGMQGRVTSSTKLSEEQKQKLSSALSETSKKIAEDKQSLENGTNLEQVRAALAVLQSNIENSKNAISNEHMQAVESSLSVVVDKAVGIYREMIQDSQKLKTAGAPTQNLGPIIESYATELEKLEFLVEDFKKGQENGGFSEEDLKNQIMIPMQAATQELSRLAQVFGDQIQNIPH